MLANSNTTMPEANNLLDDRDGDDDDAPPKKKQKRNKPTLSCSECVDRKTKVSRHQTRWCIVPLTIET